MIQAKNFHSSPSKLGSTSFSNKHGQSVEVMIPVLHTKLGIPEFHPAPDVLQVRQRLSRQEAKGHQPKQATKHVHIAA